MNARRALLVLSLIVLVGCSSGGGSSSMPTPIAAAPSGELATTPSPSPSKLLKLPDSEGRLVGKYNVKVFVTSNTFDSRPSTQQLFHFQPKCQKGACDVTLTGAMGFSQGLSDRQHAGAEKRFEVRLANLGKSYGGYKTGYFASCGTEPDKDRWTFNIKVDASKYVGDTWTVARWSGIWTRSSDFGGACTPGHLHAVIRGSLAAK
jgi:hypothetical protein